MPPIRNLDFQQLSQLLHSSFALQDRERDLSFLVDLPDSRFKDSPPWLDRRRIAADWYVELQKSIEDLPFRAINFCTYPNVGTNNGELPDRLTVVHSSSLGGAKLERGLISLRDLLSRSSIILSVTEFSATAPLKILATELNFRGATLPGFTRSMIPALGLDYNKVNHRVRSIAERLTRADGAICTFSAGGSTHILRIDLRFRDAHVSGGIINRPGTVANLPSGEAYVVPYEGERAGIDSNTEGILPVQFGEEVVLFQVFKNRATTILSEGPESESQAARLSQEPAYGNLAELGIGVLSEWGVSAVGSTLLDEKLGPHIAFGRSDHFGGATGPSAFKDPAQVVHIDWVYIESLQPKVALMEVKLVSPSGEEEILISDGKLAG